MLSPLYQLLVLVLAKTIRPLIGKLNLGHAAKVYFVAALRQGLDTFADSLAATIVT
jgi:hypothetical protein